MFILTFIHLTKYSNVFRHLFVSNFYINIFDICSCQTFYECYTLVGRSFTFSLFFFSWHSMNKTKLLRGRANEKLSVFMSVELSNFCWSECQHTRKVCIFLFQAITLQNFSSFLDLKTN